MHVDWRDEVLAAAHEESQTLHPVRRLPHDFQCHLTNHRQAREREAWRRVRQEVSRQFGDRMGNRQIPNRGLRNIGEVLHLHLK